MQNYCKNNFASYFFERLLVWEMIRVTPTQKSNGKTVNDWKNTTQVIYRQVVYKLCKRERQKTDNVCEHATVEGEKQVVVFYIFQYYYPSLKSTRQ